MELRSTFSRLPEGQSRRLFAANFLTTCSLINAGKDQPFSVPAHPMALVAAQGRSLLRGFVGGEKLEFMWDPDVLNLLTQICGIEDAHPGAYDPVARVALLDEVGIYAQIIFPGVVGLGGSHSSRPRSTGRLPGRYLRRSS